MIKVRPANLSDLYGLPLCSKRQADVRDQLLKVGVAANHLFNCFTVTAHDGPTVLCVAGFLGDGQAWSFVSADFRDSRRDFLTLARLVRAGCQEFMDRTGVTPYSIPDPGVEEAPRVAAAFGFRDAGAERWYYEG